MNAWTSIFGADELPEGTWVVRLVSERLGTLYHVATKEEGVVFVGCCFAWDMPDIVAYAAIPPDD